MERNDPEEIKDIEHSCISDLISWDTRIVRKLKWNNIVFHCHIINIDITYTIQNIRSGVLIFNEFRIT